MIPENGIQGLYVFGRACRDDSLFSRWISGGSPNLRELRDVVLCSSVNGGSGGFEGRSARSGGEYRSFGELVLFSRDDDDDSRRPILRVGETEDDRRCMVNECRFVTCLVDRKEEKGRAAYRVCDRRLLDARSASPDSVPSSGSEGGSHSVHSAFTLENPAFSRTWRWPLWLQLCGQKIAEGDMQRSDSAATRRQC